MEFVRRLIIPRKQGLYSSFPTFVEHQKKLFIFYRQGENSAVECHGLNGKVRCLEIETEPFLKAFHDEAEDDIVRSGKEQVIFAEGNEMDAIVSRLGENLFSLATRSYDKQNSMRTFLSVSASPHFEQRREISVPNVRWLAFYGKAHPCDSGFVFPAYGCIHAERITRPLLIYTRDLERFELLATLPTDIDGAELNESSLVRTEDGFAIFMRDDSFPYGIWYSFSRDLVVWETPTRLCNFAHAPMAITYENTLYLTYRDLLSEDETGITLFDLERSEVSTVERYCGNPYDGGYTDMAVIEGQLFILYYLGNEAGEPCIVVSRRKD